MKCPYCGKDDEDGAVRRWRRSVVQQKGKSLLLESALEMPSWKQRPPSKQVVCINSQGPVLVIVTEEQ